MQNMKMKILSYMLKKTLEFGDRNLNKERFLYKFIDLSTIYTKYIGQGNPCPKGSGTVYK